MTSTVNKSAVPPLTLGSANYDTLEAENVKIINNFESNNITAVSISDGIATLSGGTLSGLVAPVAGSDAANKAYVDSLIGGTWKGPVRVASTVNIPVLSGLLNIDGIVVADGDRVLVKNQAAPIENGIYTAAVGAWSRSGDLDVGSSAAGIAVIVNEGVVNDDTFWVCTTAEGSDVVGTDPLAFAQIVGGGGSPGGANTSVQFNNAGSFGGDANFLYDGVTVDIAAVLQCTNASNIFTGATNSTAPNNGTLVLTNGGLGVNQDISVGGVVRATQFIATSDATLKKDVSAIDDPLRKLKLVDPVQYKYNFDGDDRIHYGVLAQDLQEQGLGSMVHESEGKLSVNYTDLLGILVASVQELEKQVKHLKSVL